METSINEIIISVHCHITEDLSRVKSSILNILPQSLRSKLSSSISTRSVRGFYGNEIKVLELRIKGKDSIAFLKNLSTSLSTIDKSIIKATLGLRYNAKSNKLYLRLNKQMAYMGKLTIDDSDDVVKIIISFKGRHKLDDVKRLLEKMGLI